MNATEQYCTPKFRLVSFADGSLIWRNRGKHFKREAEKSKLFKEIKIYDEELLRQIPYFPKNLDNFFREEIKGFGYWLWKPLIIWHELAKLEKNLDGIAYIDVGCKFNINTNSLKRMDFYFDYTIKNKILTFHLPGFVEKEWTDPHVLETLNIENQNRDSFQRLGGILFFSNSDEAKEIVDYWLNLCLFNNSELLIGKKTNLYQAHRHDQSLWSLTSKIFEVPSLKDETYHGPNWRSKGHDFPIWAKRKSKKLNNYIHLILKLFIKKNI